MSNESPVLPSPIKTLADVEQAERSPWEDQVPAMHTYGLLCAACERQPEAIALRLLLAGSAEAPTRDLHFRELIEGVHRAANAFSACGVTARVPVAILLPNLIEGHFALWGAQAAGIAAPINPMLDASYIARLCEETKAQAIVAFGPAPGSDIWSKAVEVAEQVEAIHTIFQVDPAAAMGRPTDGEAGPRGNMPQRASVRVLDFHAAMAESDPSALTSGRAFDPNDPCAYFHTGGTTGYPKVAVHLHRNEVFLACVLLGFGPTGTRFVTLSGLPLFHVNGAIVTGLMAFHRGAEVVMLTPGGYRTPGVLDHFWAIANRFGATTFSAVPTILASLLARPWPAEGVPTLRFAGCGAAPLPRQVADDFERVTGVRIHEGYGCTEGTCVSTFNPAQGERILGTVGIRIPHQDLRLFALDAEGRPGAAATPGQIGVIGIRGPNVFPGYLRETDNRNIWIDGGWFNTGDLGRFDDGGRLVLCGRAKDLIIRGGHNIDPALIEDALAGHPEVAMAAAIGQPDRHIGELPVAFVMLKPGAQATAETLLDHARATIPERAAVPVRIEVLPALPLTAVGKISKPNLRLLAIDHVLRQALTAAGQRDTRVQARACPERGLVADLWGPAASRDAVLRLLLDFNVTLDWHVQAP